MDWVEILHIRTSGEMEFMDALSLCGRVQNELRPNNTVGVQVYRSTVYKTDLSILLYWNSATTNPAKTGFGVQLSELLSHFGLIDHNVWQPVQIGKDGVDQ